MTAGDDATVLVVEDEEALAETYARWLDDRFTVVTALTGEEAIELLEERPTVALLDRRLPGMSGDDVLDTIRSRDFACRVAMLTAVEPDFDVFEMAFDDYAVKPVLEEELNELVDRLLQLSTYDQQAQESFALASKVNVLQESRPQEELADSEEYHRALERLENLDEDIQRTLAEFEGRDFTTVYRSLFSGE